MNLLLVIPTLGHGGAQKVMVDLCHHIEHTSQTPQAPYSGNETTLVTFADSKVIPHFYTPISSVEVLTTHTYTTKGPNLLQILLLPLKLRRIARKKKVDIVVSFQDIANFPTLLSAVFSKIPIIVSERQDTRFYRHAAIRRGLRALVYPIADKVVVQTDLVKDQMPSSVKDNTRVIPNACPDLKNRAQPEKATDGRYRAVVVGRLEHQKNLQYLINACKTIVPACPNWVIEIVGDGSLKEQLQQAIDLAGLEESVLLKGPIEDIGEELCKGNLFLFPSLYEGFPNALAEAVSAGLPAIAFNDVSGVPELITHNLNGILLERENTTEESFAKAAIDLMNDNEKRKGMGKSSLMIAEKYKALEIYSAWEKLLKEATQSSTA